MKAGRYKRHDTASALQARMIEKTKKTPDSLGPGVFDFKRIILSIHALQHQRA